MKFFSFLFLCFISIQLLASDFKLKIELSMVDHSDPEGAMVVVKDRGEELYRSAFKDDDIKLKLGEGKLVEVWIYKSGYIPHVIHNVHDEGQRKFKITLFKGEVKKFDFSDYSEANRTFDDVKKMTIPAELLGDSLYIMKREALSKSEEKALEVIQKIGKKQLKAQRKIDKLKDDRLAIDKDIASLNDDIAEGKVDRTTGEEKKLKLQEDLVKVQQKLEQNAY